MNTDINHPAGIGSSQPGGDLGQLPPIHTPQSFHAPESPSHFAAPPVNAASPVAPPQPSPVVAPPGVVRVAAAPAPSSNPLAQIQGINPVAEVPADDVDTAFDEEWVNKAREVVARTREDPYLQSQTLGKLKAQYIKARYNKDIKTGDE